jgi:Interferon-induced transmembrane protein
MRCPNCSAEINDSAKECDFCGHAIAQAGVSSAAPPVAPPPPVMPPSPAASNPYSGTSSSSVSSRGNGEDIPNHMILSIVAAVLSLCTCWCIPLGIVAVVLSTQVNSKINAGDLTGARNMSQWAKIISWVTIGFFVLAIIYNIFFFDMDAFKQAMEAAQSGR